MRGAQRLRHRRPQPDRTLLLRLLTPELAARGLRRRGPPAARPAGDASPTPSSRRSRPPTTSSPTPSRSASACSTRARRRTRCSPPRSPRSADLLVSRRRATSICGDDGSGPAARSVRGRLPRASGAGPRAGAPAVGHPDDPRGAAATTRGGHDRCDGRLRGRRRRAAAAPRPRPPPRRRRRNHPATSTPAAPATTTLTPAGRRHARRHRDRDQDPRGKSGGVSGGAILAAVIAALIVLALRSSGRSSGSGRLRTALARSPRATRSPRPASARPRRGPNSPTGSRLGH